METYGMIWNEHNEKNSKTHGNQCFKRCENSYFEEYLNMIFFWETFKNISLHIFRQ